MSDCFKMQKLPQVKITTKNGLTDIFIDDYQCHHVTGILARWDNVGYMAKVTVSMLADIDIDAESAVIFKLENREHIEKDIIMVGDTVKTDNISEGIVTRIEGDMIFVNVYGSEVVGAISDFYKVSK